ncbi:hypothetical protein JB92DRAFT_2912637 [Gautieria morchelliformis]|nr:hypothetical protein JB92DRAFT_2912637 [Gautieria morchelliformis]
MALPRFSGRVDQTPRMPAEAWCTGIHTQLQPVETLRTHVRECTVQNWVEPRKFTTLIIPMLSRLDNLAILTLGLVPVSRALLQSIGRLKRLEELIMHTVITDTPLGAGTQEPVFVLQETAFPALRRFALHFIDDLVDNVLQDALCILSRAPSLRAMFVEDSIWLHRLLPLINPQFVSLCGNLTYVPPAAFLRFIKGHAALQNLTVYFDNVAAQRSYLGIDLEPADLPDLRSFGGPFAFASKVIGNRPVAKLASPCYVLLDSEPVTFLPLMEDLFQSLSRASWRMVYDDPEVWRDFKPIGGISHLFLRDVSEGTLSQIGLCFPNLVHLQLELPMVTGNIHSHEPFWNVAQAFLRFKSLKTLALCSKYGAYYAFWMSPRKQHDFVHDIFQCCPTLKQVVFDRLMVWHLRALPTRAGECHCELELLSPRMIRRELQRLGTGQQVCDWQGRLARLLREGPSGLSEVDIGGIVKPEA